ncbi:MAG: hypothetical protein AB7S71_07895 [Dongiaceae bacterium]
MSENDQQDGTDNLPDQKLFEFLKERVPPGLDGVWHPQTIALAQKFRVAAFDLNRWWCLTPTDWACPGCNRGKPDIVRVNQHGELMCHLVEHHDHMGRYIEKCLADHVGRLPAFFATTNSERFARRSAPAISAFDRTIICEDCNVVDTRAKKQVQAHPDFSFTARDIRKFVIARPNQPHEIDSAKLREVWTFREEQLGRRFELAQRIAELAATNEHWYEQAEHRHHADSVEHHAKLNAIFYALRQWDVDISQFESVSAPKPIRVSSVKGWRRNKRLKADKPPNAQELRYAADVTHSAHYAKLPDDWTCPWCQRSKNQCVRPSKQFKYSFSFHERWVIDLQSGKKSKVVICQDCADVRVQIAKEANADTKTVQPIDVMSIIRPEPHAQHGLASDAKIDAVVSRIADRAVQLGLSKDDDFDWD